MTGVIPDLERKLKAAQRSKARAEKDWEIARDEAQRTRQKLDACAGTVSEIATNRLPVNFFRFMFFLRCLNISSRSEKWRGPRDNF